MYDSEYLCYPHSQAHIQFSIHSYMISFYCTLRWVQFILIPLSLFHDLGCMSGLCWVRFYFDEVWMPFPYVLRTSLGRGQIIPSIYWPVLSHFLKQNVSLLSHIYSLTLKCTEGGVINSSVHICGHSKAILITVFCLLDHIATTECNLSAPDCTSSSEMSLLAYVTLQLNVLTLHPSLLLNTVIPAG